MSYFSYISSFFSKPAELSYLAETLEPAIQAAEQQKKQFYLISGDTNPQWCNDLIEKHIQLKKETNNLINEGKRDIIPIKVLDTLEKSQALVNQLAYRIGNLGFVQEIFEKCPAEYADPAKLLTLVSSTAVPSHSSVREWEINFALLKSAYDSTQDETTRQNIRFLIVNYLAKSAFLDSLPRAGLAPEESENYRDLMQIGQLSSRLSKHYHRSVQLGEPGALITMLEISDKIAAEMLNPNKGELFCTDNSDVSSLLPLAFSPTAGLTDPESTSTEIAEQFENSKDKFTKCKELFPHDQAEFSSVTYKTPCIIDITSEVGEHLITQNDNSRETSYRQSLAAAKTLVDSIVDKAADKILQQHPDLKESLPLIKDYIRMNLIVISRAEWDNQLAILAHHKKFFPKEEFSKRPGAAEDESSPFYQCREAHLDMKLRSWIGTTGISPGAVAYRQILAQLKENPDDMITESRSGQAVRWAPTGSRNTYYFSSPKDITSSVLFKNLADFIEQREETDSPSLIGQKLLADITLKMCNALLSSIPEEQWATKQQDPAIREVTQFSLYRLKEHLATAYHNRADFRIFSQAVDCAHSELTNLLTLYSPFENAEQSFEINYSNYLTSHMSPLPEAVKLQAALGKSAMNIFAGINATIIHEKPNALRITDPHSYYEEVELVGETLSMQKAIESGREGDVDLYVGEFYHNIDIAIDHTRYEKGSVVEDIRAILSKKNADKSLTVAIDATIDLTSSENIKDLIHSFQEEIQSGKLNIIVFRSGQKFDMFGLDNYFGAPFYLINNGNEKWNKYLDTFSQPIFHTDHLSQQYFCLMSRCALEKTDEYKKLIFDNTRVILNLVPEELKPKEGRDICVCSFDADVETPFIDIRFGPEDEKEGHPLISEAVKIFIELFTRHGKIAYRRGSFGFAHANITPIEPKIRINPGIDPEEIVLYKQFFDELAAKAKGLEET